MSIPAILIAISDYRTQENKHLRELGRELDSIQKALAPAEQAGICELIIIAEATVEKIVNTFKERKDSLDHNPIVAFHFAGHADGYDIMLRDDANGKELAGFLGEQAHLEWVFLNACSTFSNTQDLHREGISAVISTSQVISDSTAQEFASDFYTQLGLGKTLESSFYHFQQIHEIKQTELRSFLFKQEAEIDIQDWPWKLRAKEGNTEIWSWSLGKAAQQPLFGLPPIVDRYDLPSKPFRSLQWFEPKHAKIFFGRGQEIRDLYTLLVDDYLPPIILLYGQSGVGKSSLLGAGLLPRIEDQFDVLAVRKEKDLSLSQQLLEIFDEAKDLKTAWKQKEKDSGRPFLVILDQVEEVITQAISTKKAAVDLEDVGKLLLSVFERRDDRPKGKIILSFRKEYYAEIQTALERAEVSFQQFFLQKLSKHGIMEAINGIHDDPRLSNHYKVEIDPELAPIIADDLEEDHMSAIAPILQVLLSKMWEEAKRISTHSPRFDTTLYQSLKREGILLSDFLRQKLDEISSWNHEVAESGLVLDLLIYHTTELNTSAKRALQDIRQRYAHREDILERLLHEIRQTYLLIDAYQGDRNDEPALSLAHDTLAPLIKKLYETSDKKGQLADRILKNQVPNFVREPSKSLLDEHSLSIVEEGRPGMRIWEVNEEALVEASRSFQKRLKRNRRFAISGGFILTSLLAVSMFFLWQNSERTANINLASKLFANAQMLEPNDPQQAIDCLSVAIALDPKLSYREKYYQVKRDHIPYRNLFHIDSTAFSCFAISPNGKTAAVGLRSGELTLYDLSQEGFSRSTLLKQGTEESEKVIFLDNETLASYAIDREVSIWNTKGEKLRKLNGKELGWRGIQDITNHPMGLFIVPQQSQTLYQWDWQNEVLVLVLTIPEGITQVFQDQTHNTLNFSTPTNRVYQFAPTTRDTVLLAKEKGPIIFASHSDEYLVMSSENAKLKRDGKLIHALSQGINFLSGGFLPEQHAVWLGEQNGRISLFDTETGKILGSLVGHTHLVVSFLARNHFFYSNSMDGSIRRWPSEGIFPPSFSLDTPRPKIHLAIGDQLLIEGNGLMLYSPKEQNTIPGYSAHKDRVRLIDFEAKTGNVFSYDGFDPAIHMWSISDNNDPIIFTKPQFQKLNHISALSNRFVTAQTGSGHVVMWDNAGKITDTLSAHSDELTVLELLDSRQLLSASYDSTLVLWDIETKEKVQVFTHENIVEDAVFLPSLDQFVSLTLDPALLWWTVDGSLIRKKILAHGSYSLMHESHTGSLWVINHTESKSFLFNKEGFHYNTLPFSLKAILANEGKGYGMNGSGELVWGLVP